MSAQRDNAVANVIQRARSALRQAGVIPPTQTAPLELTIQAAIAYELGRVADSLARIEARMDAEAAGRSYRRDARLTTPLIPPGGVKRASF